MKKAVAARGFCSMSWSRLARSSPYMHGVGLRLDGGGAGLVVEEAHLAEEVARPQPREHLLDAPLHVLGDDHRRRCG